MLDRVKAGVPPDVNFEISTFLNAQKVRPSGSGRETASRRWTRVPSSVQVSGSPSVCTFFFSVCRHTSVSA